MSSGSEDEAHGGAQNVGKKRKTPEVKSESSCSDGGVPGIPTDDGLCWDLGNNKLLRVKVGTLAPP